MTVSHERWHQLEELFNAARELPPDQRESLFRAHALDSGTRREIEELLRAHDALAASGEEGFLDSPAAMAAFLQPLAGAEGDPERAQRQDGSGRFENSRDPLGISGKTISHFHVKDYLAAGGMGVLYTADDLQLGRTVALKFPLPHQHMEQAVKERFFREARATAALDHPNLCTVYEVGESSQGVFMAMPLYKGETLRDRLERDRTLSLAEAIRITRELATGLASAHAAGIVHRDMKPGNVMLLPDGAVKILDFGIAKALDATFTKSRETLGTIAYMAPEQIRNDRIDGRTDLWAVGVMLYRMLTGVLPFPGDTDVAMLHAILHDEPQRAPATTPAVRRVLNTVVAGLLQKKPADRYPSADTLLADLDALDSGRAPAHRVPLWKRGVPRRMRVPLSAAGILFAISAGSSIVSRTAGVAANAAAGPPLRFVNNTAVIRTSEELLAALSPANAGKRIHLRAGTYDIDRPLIVPDGMTLEGEGVMTFAPEGYATGFRDGSRTTIRMTAAAGGDLLTLGNNVTLRNLEMVDLDGRIGNLVRVESRRPGDSVSARIIESVLLNPNPYRAGNLISRGLVVTTRNANGGADPPPDEGAAVSVQLLQSVVKSPAGGGGFFAFNFAANSRVSLEISRSLVEGQNEANGGVSDPDAVHNSEVRLTSHDNVYRSAWADPCAQPVTGWNLSGGSGVPRAQQLPETARNRLIVHSTNDRLEGFTSGILATGSRRFYPPSLHGPSTGNRIELLLVGTAISTPECPWGVGSVDVSGMPGVRTAPVSDLVLVGSSVPGNAFAPGDSNIVRAELRDVSGSGTRANSYRHASGFSGIVLAPEFRGRGNRVEIVGDPETFSRLNRGIDPPPAPELFTEKARPSRSGTR